MSENCKSERAKPAAQTGQRLELAAVREKLGQLRGKRYWRSLEELAEADEFREMLHREFPRQASAWPLEDGVSRRNFLQVMGASLALAGLAGCTKQPVENIVPYVRQPEEIIPGKPLYFASAMPLSDTAMPVLVKSDMGRPIKVDGNPDHPAGSVGSDIFMQASLLGLYDPDRSQTITEVTDTGVEVRTWGMFMEALKGPMGAQKAIQGSGLRFLTGASTSPTFASQMKSILKAFPLAKWHQYEAVNRDNARAGAVLAFGQPLQAQYQLENAAVILSLDADFLSSVNNPDFLRMARGFAKRRKAENGRNMNRLYVAESMMTSTGGKADHRLPLKASEIAAVAQAIAAHVAGGTGASVAEKYAKFVAAAVNDLNSHRGSSVVLAGETQPAAVHALAHTLNSALGNVGKTVVYTDPVAVTPDGFSGSVDSLKELASDIQAGKVDMLVILGTNVAYTAPDDLGFAHRDGEVLKPMWPSILQRVSFRVHLGLYQDETALLCQWHVNEAHYLESWSDVRTIDGTPSIVQPLIDPLYGGKTAHEVLGQFTEKTGFSSYEWVRDYWHNQHSTVDYEGWWRKALHDGFIANAALEPRGVTAKPMSAPANAGQSPAGMEIVFRPDPTVHDGRFANNGWLQELPKPITMFTWDNAALFSFSTAEKHGISSEDVVELDVNGRKLKTVAWVLTGVPDDCVTIHLGYGRYSAGRVGNNHGYNAYLLRTSDAPHIAALRGVTKTGERHEVAAVHLHHNVDVSVNNSLPAIGKPGEQEFENRGIVRWATLDEFEKNPQFAHGEFEEPNKDFTLYKPEEHKYDKAATKHAWGMSIDLNACIGCSTCVVACQAENNIPVVGQWEVRRGREMHWIRIDHYYEGDFNNPRAHYQPVTCMQCENAPCELVCPVGATVHSTEGLNDMVYNRCVGTRYCSNNCPYKVRRFNFLLYSDFDTPQFKLMNNPDVSVRSRGVMEKCTYCIQRITRARVEAEKLQTVGEGEGVIPDGSLNNDPHSLKTACQQACPADAIVFGNLNDENSRVSQLKKLPLNYGMLADLNTRPRTTYLAEVINPSPDLMEQMRVLEPHHVLGRGHGPEEESSQPENKD